MRIRNIKEQYPNRRYIIKKGEKSPENNNIVYIGNLKTDKYDMLEVNMFYVFDNHEVKTVLIYIPDGKR